MSLYLQAILTFTFILVGFGIIYILHKKKKI
ncbi:hypothetical protein SAMN05446037_100231 [Anaerovirgula multivorans]|uniref:Uncharacterized protein n=1 Tax=Anaerovirgula multivorans TaxID=312168 RepID=A0A239AIV9_9FIRM|nr:hypothetical protein SAMN05446037_100231 [Anaerovirgula multivorans]